jgi:hypothetical protein
MDDERNAASFQHTGLCCFASITGPDADRAYGCEPVAVVGYGHRTWSSFSMWLVPT